MMVSEQSLADIRARATMLAKVEGLPVEAGLTYLFAQDHQSRITAVQRGVDFACNLLEQHKHKKQGNDGKGMGEDEITLEICEMLTMAGFQPAHDDDVGGHCDIVIKGRSVFLWLAEAKKHHDYPWLDKGFKQLSTRYSTGVEGQDHGEVIIYCYTQDAKAMLANWRKELTTRNPDVVADDSACGSQFLFCSRHKHAASGQDFHIRHKVIALYWDPKDK